jgi:hypothetical protein
VVIEEQPLSAHLKDVMVVERDGRRRAVRVIIAQQRAALPCFREALAAIARALE